MYWDRTGVAIPSISRQVSPGKIVRLYGVRELMALLVAAELRRAGVPLDHIRKVVAHLNARGYESPLTELVFATVGKQIYFRNDDGTWESQQQPHQIVIHQVLELEPIRARIREAALRDTADVGKVERRRGALGSKPVVAGTRIPVATVLRYLEDGCSVDEILTSYPALHREDVEAVRHQASVA
jgi:uncharacterized protein (DUF433 family)